MTLATLVTAEPTILPVMESETLYEIVDGKRVEKPPMGNFQAVLASLLVQRLGNHAWSEGLGRVVCEALFRINPAGGPQRRPDVAFVSYARWARDRKITSENGWDVVPDLAVEVVSPSDLAEDVVEKVHEYLRAGVSRVWLVHATVRQVWCFESTAKVVIWGPGESLDGGDLLPGLTLSIDELFEDGA